MIFTGNICKQFVNKRYLKTALCVISTSISNCCISYSYIRTIHLSAYFRAGIFFQANFCNSDNNTYFYGIYLRKYMPYCIIILENGVKYNGIQER